MIISSYKKRIAQHDCQQDVNDVHATAVLHGRSTHLFNVFGYGEKFRHFFLKKCNAVHLLMADGSRSLAFNVAKDVVIEPSVVKVKVKITVVIKWIIFERNYWWL